MCGQTPSLRAIVARVVLGMLIGLVAPVGEVAAERPEWNRQDRFPSNTIPKLRLSLEDAIKIALDNNVEFRISQEGIRLAEGAAEREMGPLLPNISGTARRTEQTFFLGTFGIDPRVAGPFEFWDFRTRLTQNLFSLSLIQRWRAALTDQKVAELETEITRQDTIAMVALLYLEALRTEASVEARQADVQLNRKLLRLAVNRKRAGMATQLDVTRQKVQLENEKQRLLVAQNERNRSKLNLIRGMGITFRVEIDLTDDLDLVEVPEQTPEEAVTVARSQRVELKAQAKRERLAALTLNSATSERIPALTFNGDVGKIGLVPQPDELFFTRSATLEFSMPIFDGQREGRISERRSDVRREQLRTQDIRDQITLEVRDALLSLESAEQQVEVARKGLELAFEEVELAKERFSVGVVTSLEISDAQARLAQARDNVIQALFSFNTARVNLARAQGHLKELY